MKLVKYVGTKEYKNDRFFGTRQTWNGNGDVQEVDDGRAQRMCAMYPEIWVLVERDAKPPKVLPPAAIDNPQNGVLFKTKLTLPNGAQVPLIEAPRSALVGYARDEFGLAVTDGHTKDDILTFIASIEELVTNPAGVAVNDCGGGEPSGLPPLDG